MSGECKHRWVKVRCLAGIPLYRCARCSNLRWGLPPRTP